jgi:hypothetical protein
VNDITSKYRCSITAVFDINGFLAKNVIAWRLRGAFFIEIYLKERKL